MEYNYALDISCIIFAAITVFHPMHVQEAGSLDYPATSGHGVLLTQSIG
jgi:hypothetical protein